MNPNRRETLYEPYPKEFPGYFQIANAEAQILRNQDEVVKVYKPEYPYEVVKRYADATTSMALSLHVGEHVVDIRFSNLETKPFEIRVNPVLEVGTLQNGQTFTRSAYIPWLNLEELYIRTVLNKELPITTWTQEMLSENRVNGVGLIVKSTEQFLLTHGTTQQTNIVAIHEQNLKVFEMKDVNYIFVTDPSKNIKSLIGR